MHSISRQAKDRKVEIMLAFKDVSSFNSPMTKKRSIHSHIYFKDIVHNIDIIHFITPCLSLKYESCYFLDLVEH